MIELVTREKEINDIIKYIGQDYKSTPYLYVNVIKYGLETKNVCTWIDWNSKNNEKYIAGVYFLYYDCIHFYTKDVENYPVDRLLAFIRRTEHKVIMLQGRIGDRIDNETAGYYSERNYIIDMDKVGLEERSFRSEIAQRTDISAIVDLLMADPEYTNVYDYQILSNQMYDRYDRQFSRYFIIRMDGRIVAACSTYGEVPGFALLGGVIVHPDYRRRGLAGDVESYACHVLANEKISRVGFVNIHNTASLALHEKLGAYRINVLAKLVKGK